MQNQSFFIPVLSTAPVRVVKSCEGGFGRVYVVATQNGELYAIKKLRNKDASNQNQLREEALKIARLSPHPNIIEIFDVTEIEESPAMILRYYPRSLRDVLRDGSLSDTKMQLLSGVVCGLKFLHETGSLLHGDLKPENVLISSDGQAVLSDFGLAKYLPKPEPAGLLRDLFVSGAAGTVAYMSPEQFITGKATQMSDIFALGIIAFEMLTGTHPFLRATYDETVRSILYDSPQFAPIRHGILLRIERVAVRCLAKNPAHRPTAVLVLNELGDTRSTKGETPAFDLAGSVNRANALAALGEFEKAKTLFELCIDQQPWSLPARIGLAGCLRGQQKIDQAIGVAEDALAIAPWCPEQASSLGTLLVDLAYFYLVRDPEKSLKYSAAAIEQNINDWQALANYAESCRLLAKAYPQRFGHLIDEGTRAALRGLELNPADSVLRITYGGLLFLKRDFATLSPMVVTIINEVGGQNIPARALLIETLLATGQLDDAEKWIRPMLGVQGLEPLAKQYLSQLHTRRGVGH